MGGREGVHITVGVGLGLVLQPGWASGGGGGGMGVCVGVNTTAWMGRWRLTLQPGRVPSQPEVWLLTRLESKVCRHHPTKCIIFLP